MMCRCQNDGFLQDFSPFAVFTLAAAVFNATEQIAIHQKSEFYGQESKK